jgi:hypothetical protein
MRVDSDDFRPLGPHRQQYAPTAGWAAQYALAGSTPRTKNAVDSASASAAVRAVTVTLAIPSAGQPVRGSR